MAFLPVICAERNAQKTTAFRFMRGKLILPLNVLVRSADNAVINTSHVTVGATVSKLSVEIQKMLFKKTGHNFTVEFENKRNGGGMFWSDEFVKQRLGYNQRQAEDFIENFDWSWVKNHVRHHD